MEVTILYGFRDRNRELNPSFNKYLSYQYICSALFNMGAASREGLFFISWAQ